MNRTRVFVQQTGRRIAPFDDPIGETPILNRPLADWQAEAFKEGGFVVTPTLQPPCLVVPDTIFASGSVLRGFVDGAAGHDAVLVLKRSEFANKTIPVQPNVYEVDDGHLFEAIRFVSGADERPRQVLVDPQEQVFEFDLPGQYTGGGGIYKSKIGLPRRPVMTLHHWTHVLWANLFAAGYEARSTPLWKGVLHVLSAVLRARSLNRWKVLRKLSTHGKRCDIHPSAIIEGSRIGDGVTIGANARVLFSRIGNGTTILSGTTVEYSILGENTWVSPNLQIRFCVLYPDALGGSFMQLSVAGRNSMTTGAAIRDLNLERDIRVELDGALHSVGQQFMGSAFGHRSRVGAGVTLAAGRTIPNDYVIVGPTAEVLSKIPPGLAGRGTLQVVDGTLRPLRTPGGVSSEELTPAANVRE